MTGANSLVFAFLMVVLAAVLALGTGAAVSFAELVQGMKATRNEGHMLWLFLLGVNNAVKSVAFMLALGYVSALNAAIYIPLIPVFAIVFARAIGWETLNWGQVLGVSVAICGALEVTFVKYASESSQSGAANILIGNGLLLTWDITAAVAIVMQKPLLKYNSPINVSAYVLTIAALVLAVVIPFVEHPTSSAWDIQTVTGLAIIYCAFYNCFMNFGDAWAVTIIPASTVSMWLTLEPVFTAILSATFLDESMTSWEYLGAALTCVGLGIVLYSVDKTKVWTGKGGDAGEADTRSPGGASRSSSGAIVAGGAQGRSSKKEAAPLLSSDSSYDGVTSRA
uniref:EamA domain-containing protein n=1 Tax=Octactis speculum TaxID=3111310 RepID=A0A7S2BMF9_9STRA